MKLILHAISLLLFIARLNAAEIQIQKSAMLVLSPNTQTAEGRSAVDKLKAALAAQGISVTEIPADEAQDIGQAGLIGGGGQVYSTRKHNGKIEFMVHDGVSGADITKAFNANTSGSKSDVKAESKQEPVSVVAEKPATKASPVKESPPYKKNHIGLSIGQANLFNKNKDTLDMLADTNPGGQVTLDGMRGSFQLSYERTLSPKYTLGLMAGREIGGSAEYERNGGNVYTEPQAKTATLYVIRRFNRNFGLFAGAGPDFYSFTISDPVIFSGATAIHSMFQGEASGAHAEAGFLLAAGNFSLRLGLKQVFFGDAGDITSNFTGGGSYAPGKYKLIIKNGQTMDFKAVGQALAADEKLFKTDFGGKAVTLALTYAFANW